MGSFNLLVTAMLGSIYGITIGSATGFLGGITMALVVKLLLKSIDVKDFMVIILGWFIGIIAGFTFFEIAIPLAESNSVFNIVIVAVSALIAGGIGSGTMYSVIDRALEV